jgi:hypothetical protein
LVEAGPEVWVEVEGEVIAVGGEVIIILWSSRRIHLPEVAEEAVLI